MTAGRSHSLSVRAAVLFGALSLLPLKRMFSSRERFARMAERAARRPPALPRRRLRRRFDVGIHGDVVHPLVRLAPRDRAPAGEIFFTHGGAFALDINGLHWRFLGSLVERTGFAVSSSLYPLLGQADGDAIRNHIDRNWDIAQSLSEGRRFSLIGDSAGAALALGLASRLSQAGESGVASLVLLSPWLDLELADPEHEKLDALDAVLALPGLREAARMFAGSRPLRDPLVSPILGDLSCLPPTLVMTGDRDLLHPNALQFAELARQRGIAVSLFDRSRMVHNWMLLPVPEAKHAQTKIVDFIVAAHTDVTVPEIAVKQADGRQ